MANKEIAESVNLSGIKHTGFALRDWLGPYYMLGGAVAFGIAMLTVLDPSGLLVRAVGALLLALTILAWAYHFYRQKQSPVVSDASQSQAPLHGILLAITIFFLCGILISETLVRGKRAPVAPPEDVVVEAAPDKPMLPVPVAEPAAKVAAPAAQAPAVAAVVLPSQAAPLSGDAPAPVLASAPGARTPLPPRIDVLADSPNTSPKSAPTAPRNEPVVVAERSNEQRSNAAGSERSERAAPPVNRQRCSSLIGKFSLGEELSAEDKRYLETSCR